MTTHRHSPKQEGSAWKPVHDILEGVEQAVAEGWYPARRMLLSSLAGSLRPELAAWVPEVDVADGPSEISVAFALPGVGKEDIRLQVTEDAVTISGRRPDDADAARAPGRREIPRGEFLRRVRLPAEVKPESAKALYRDGILRVTMARVRVEVGRSVKIE